MKFISTIVFTFFFIFGVIAQDLYKEKSLTSPAQTISNYNYKTYVGSSQGILYYNQIVLPSETPSLIKVSPLGNEAVFLIDGKIILYNTLSFKILQKDNNKIKDTQFSSIINNEDGSSYYINSLEGKLFSLQASQKKLMLTPIPLDFFVSQLYWHENLNQILLADDYYLQYYDPASKKTSQRIKLDSDITVINAHERKFIVTVGLSNGTLVVLNQNLNEILFETQISKASLTSIVEDPLDHYLYIGDENGTLFTYDILKKEVIKKEELHSGAIKMGSVYEPHSKKKFLITIGSDKQLKFLSITNLPPNFNRIVEEKVILAKENFITIKNGETAVAYDNRVNDGSIKTIIEKLRNQLHDSIAKTKLTGKKDFKIVNDSLRIQLDPFAPIQIKLFKKIEDLEKLSISEAHYLLKEDNSFEIKSLLIENPNKNSIKYSSDRKTMRVYEEEISIALAKEVAKKEAEFKTSLSDVVTNLRSNGGLNDVVLSVNSVLKKEKDSLGNNELNLHVTFLSQGIKAEIQKQTADFPSGKYDIFDSEAATTLVGFFIKSSGEKLGDYLTDGRKVTFRITGATDKSKITNTLPYDNEYGSFNNFPYYFQGQLAGLILNQEKGIKNNSQLGFLRTYAVRNFIENYSDVFENTKRKYIHYSEEADAYGAEYRKIKIEMVIHKVDQLAGKTSSTTNTEYMPLSDVDINIPKGNKTPGYALVIGNEDYASFQRNLNKESNVPFAIRDGESFKNYLHQMYGMPLENIDFLKNATFGEMSQAISRLERLMELDGENKDIIVFYSGHGMPDEQTKEPFLIPVDINGTNVSQGIALKDLMKRLSEKPHGKISIIIDACFSGLGKNKPLASVKGITIKPVNPELGANMLLISSSSGNESSVVDQDNQHGLFTYHFLKILKETKGNISIQDLYNRLRKDVGINAIKKLDKVQTPTILLGKNLKEKVGTSKIIGK